MNFLQTLANINFIHINDREYIDRQILTYICPGCKVKTTELAEEGHRHFDSTYYRVCVDCKFTRLICLHLHFKLDSNLLNIISSFIT